VARNLKKHIARYQEDDKRAEGRRSLLERLRKRKQRDDFRAFVAGRRDAWLAARPQRLALGSEEPEGSEGVTIIEQVVELEISETIEVVP
jgi:hypothetical protein